MTSPITNSGRARQHPAAERINVTPHFYQIGRKVRNPITPRAYRQKSCLLEKSENTLCFPKLTLCPEVARHG